MAPESSGEKVGKDEEVAGKLTEGLIWAKEGRKGVVDGEGKASVRATMVAGGVELDSAV